METAKQQSLDQRRGKCSWMVSNPGMKCAWNDQQSDELPCILHVKNPGKELAMFQKAVQKVQEAVPKGKNIDLTGVVFPSNWKMHEWIRSGTFELDRSISFHSATFQGEVRFDHGWFSGRTIFDSAIFQEKVNIYTCGIEGEITFSHATFQKAVLIGDVAFHQEVLFNDTCFQDKVTFEGTLPVEFKGDVSFKGAKFLQEVFFSDTKFEKNVFFENTEFHGPASFSSPHGQVCFSDLGQLNFNGAQFQKEMSFDNLIFNGEVSFQRALFMKEASFNQTEFQKKVDFDEALFEAAVSFRNAQFKGNVFMGAYFKSLTNFIGTKDCLLFSDGGRLVGVSFERAYFFQPHFVFFRNVNFSKCILVGADVRGIDFHGVIWPEIIPSIFGVNLKFWKRKCLFEPRTKEPEALESAYRQIRQSYEDRRNYPASGDFYYGEMDKKRKANKWRKWLPSLTWLYWLSSGYGQRPSQAIIILLVLPIFFNGLFIWSGMAPVENVNFLSVLLSYTLKISTLQSPLHFSPVSPWGEFLTILAGLFIPIQAALVVLAVNRAFKR
ncbi:MAG TPA: hypothetical protein DD706_00365 [Nitrospiraceae bacterium]|nr:hypothetical protein [Nitrospiraceae bacterium]